MIDLYTIWTIPVRKAECVSGCDATHSCDMKEPVIRLPDPEESKHSNEMVAQSGGAGSGSTFCKSGWFSVSAIISLTSSSDSISGGAGSGSTFCKLGRFSVSAIISLTSSSDKPKSVETKGKFMRQI
ncbi:hypothetical protein MAR_007038 [Mya arenaria]|uniref:Uncharacterized protein n=1 Tax=Mya arenaria TaxID=6604 RepID=A0ABY7DA90_MYAAR|nr:hypothetical protein MAR_007038 [Mya arenaria]